MENIPTKSQIHTYTLKGLLILVFFISPFITLNAQDTKKAEKEFRKALEYINLSNYEKALINLNKSLEYNPNYPDALLAIAEIYYNQYPNIDSLRLKSYQFYKKLVDISPDFDKNAHYRLGDYYIKEYNTQKASYHYQYYLSKQKAPKDNKKIEDVNRKLKKVEFVKTNLDSPVEFKPVNMGININTINDDYFPILTADEKMFIFTSLTPNEDKENTREPYFEDFFVSYNTKGDWSKSQKMPPPFNSNSNEGALTISPDGRVAYFARCNSDDGFGSCDIYYSEKNGNAWNQPKNLGADVNSSSWDSQPSIASDGRTLFFVSSREGGFGKSDIWYTYKKDDGTWTKPKNLGPTINTEGEEKFPFIHPSNTTLYFTSDYHIGMGGQDIFYSRIENGKFTEPINLGYPINTSSDEVSFIVSPSGKQGIFSTDINGTFGKKDIYYFDLYKEAQPIPIVYMKGRVLDSKTKEAVSALFEVRDIENNRLIASTTSDKKTGEYLVILPLGGNYALNSYAKNYLFYSENFALKDLNIKDSYEKDVYLTPILEGETVVLNNVFFASNSSELLPSSEAELNTLTDLLKKNPQIIIEISGHTDNTGNPSSNMELSNKRAVSVKTYLETKGISSERLISKGYGQTKPIAENTTEEGRAKNRRTEFKIIRK
ncbi:MAG: outer membrane protein/peptidoglycan-associated protein [Bacteroidetes bacterium]|nr:outer membrane protein/peptidoglycan-associated protein [Bacteroidota bacterium]